ncbi:hypothetical protein KVR01_011251 [Diaporthe batatas]|uniref:uncharacterized protein n=1 Tax=Diaporthe batatas TaxID=748121 RepID=UPI001D055870|nr:uncharacterized protein KVR01_011251 [Diaporthe batatas]KAG8158808.1 hypothetical protein KVR01_011251 [Diaporthe batatas]
MGGSQVDSEQGPLLGAPEDEWHTEKLHSDDKPAAKGIQWSRVAWSLVPWVIAAPLGKTERKLPKVTSTSYLNGLRGVACLIVFNYHVMISFDAALKSQLGATLFANVTVAGHGATMVFFVLSGFVLSYSPLSKISSPDAADSAVLTALWSAVIRRGLRLFSPLFALATMLALITFFTGLYGPKSGSPWADDATLGGFWNHVVAYATNVSYLLDPFTWNIMQLPTLEHCWTLPFEYRGSFVVFLLCLACSRLSPRCRKLVLVAFALWALHWIRWDVFCFTAGMFLAELRFQPLLPLSVAFSSSPRPAPGRQQERLPISTADTAAAEPDADAPPRRPWARLARAVPRKHLLAFLALVPSVVVCAWPDGAEEGTMQPYATIHAVFTPSHYVGTDIDFLYASVGALMVLASLEALPPAQWLLSTTPFRYFGEISFSFYLLHYGLLNILSAHALVFLTASCGWDISSAFALTWVLTAVVCLLASDLFWRGVDETSVRLSRKITDWLIVRPRENEIAYHAL